MHIFVKKVFPCLQQMHNVNDSDVDLLGEVLRDVLEDQVLRDVLEDQRRWLATLLGLPAGCEMILCPFGSDAEYIPVAIARSMTAKHIMGGVSQLNDMGAGTAPDSTGK